ncbi:GDSL-type esterase/lipase family protein [Paramuribaculum intestinale]|uniref:GDSL-type esterase/lipase family protein n=1 Tax=Paramuribaculum intestinale TaxID=2094151 RepID=UPI0034E575C4
MALYSGWDNLTYYAEGGMTIYNMFQRQVAKEDGQKISVEEALQKHTFGKIYLEIGINEMGTGTLDSFMEAYENAVNHLRELQPDAILYLCGIMYVKQSKSESDPIFNNPNIQARNDRIAQLADGENIFYLDINELVTDETGNLNPDYTWDEVDRKFAQTHSPVEILAAVAVGIGPCGLDAAVGVVGGDYSGSDHKAGVVDVAGKRVLIDHRKLQRESVQAAHSRPDAFGKSIYAYGVFACLDEAAAGGGAVVAPCVAEADAEGFVAVVVSDAGK